MPDQLKPFPGAPKASPQAHSPSEPEPNVAASAAYMEGHALMSGNNIDGALAAYSRAVDLEPTPRWKAYLLHARGFFLLAAKGDRDGALADFSEAIGLDQKILTATFLEARSGVWIDKQGYDRAITDLNAAIQLNAERGCRDASDRDACKIKFTLPAESRLRSLRGEAYMYKADYARALADLDRAVALDPKNAVAHTNRARVHASRNDFTAALKDADRAVALDPKSGPAHFYRGLVHKLSGHWDLAIADLEKALEINPRDALARSKLEEVRRSRPPAR